jgi:hypothetical protein
VIGSLTHPENTCSSQPINPGMVEKIKAPTSTECEMCMKPNNRNSENGPKLMNCSCFLDQGKHLQV